MPALTAAELTALRTTVHATLLRVGVYVPATIWTAQVDGAQTTGLRAVTVKNVVQVRAPAKHYQVFFGSAAGGTDLGEARWKSYSAPTLTLAAHNAALADNTFITVKENIRPQDVPCTLDDNDVTREDGDTAYTDQNLHYAPLARIGPPAVAVRDPTTGLATVKFYQDALAVEPATTLTLHTWNFVDGTPAPGGAGTLAHPYVVTYPSAGPRWVSYTATCSNGKTHTTYRPVLIYDRVTGTLPYTQVELSNAGGDLESGGWNATVKILADAPVTSFPNQAQVIVFAEDWYGAPKVSIGGQWSWRENVVLVGFIRRGSVTKDWQTGAVEFELEGIGRLADNLGALGLSLESAAAPTDWHQLAGLDYNLAAYHLLTEHSTLSQLADVRLDLPTYVNDYVDFQDGNLRDQLAQQACVPVRGQFGSSAQGILYLQADPQLLPLASRVQPVVLSTTNADLQAVELGTEQHETQVSQIDFCSEDHSGEPFFSLAPPNAHPHGRAEKIDGWRADTQEESNILSGLLEGKLNNSYDDVTLRWRGNYRVFDPFPAEAVQVNLSASQNRRGLVWTNQRTWTKRVTYDYPQPGVLLVATVVAKDAYGPPGITGEYPPVEPPLITFPPIELPVITNPVIVTRPSNGDGSRVYVATDVGVASTDAFLDAAPAWTARNTGLAGDALKCFKFYFDPWSSTGALLQKAYVVTKAGIYKNSALPAGAWSCVLSAAQVNALCGAGTVTFPRWLVAPMNVENYVGLWVQVGDGAGWERSYWVYSRDAGVTWHANTANWINTTVADEKGFVYFKVWPSHKTASTFYLLASTGQWWGSGSVYEAYRFFKTTDAGLHWVYVDVYNAASNISWRDNMLPWMTLPFANGSGVPYASDSKVWRHRAGYLEYHAAFPALPPATWTTSLDVQAAGSRFGDGDLCTWDEDYQYYLDVTLNKVRYTNNGGAAWSSHDTPHAVYALSCLPSNAEYCATAGSPAAAELGAVAWLELTKDGGATWADRTGDLAAVLAGIKCVWGLVPDWVKEAAP